MIDLKFEQKENIGFQYVLDILRPNSPYGEEAVRRLNPFTPAEKTELLRQLGNVQRVLEGEERCQNELNRMLRVFMCAKNIRATVLKCGEAALNEIELFEVKRFLLQTEEMKPYFKTVQSVLHLEGVTLEDTSEALEILDPEHNRIATFYISDSYSPRLRAIRKEKKALEDVIRRTQSGSEREEAQTKRVRVAADEEHEEARIRGELSERLRPSLPAMLHNMQTIADLDLTVEKARLARKYGGVMPEITESRVVMEDMLNPQIADLLEERGKTFTPVSIALDRGATVITGANMGGKSVALKTIALNILLAHCGFFPFARRASVPLFDGMYIISEDLESIDRGLSSFGGEIVRFNQVAEKLSEGFAFILLDEFARGTNPDEGAAIVQAVTAWLNTKNAVTVLATHYDNVAQLGAAHYQVIGLKELNVEALRNEIANACGDVGVELIARHMNYGLYRVEERQDCPRDALNICRLLGMREDILAVVEKNYENR
ncbi:MAG: DNA mismatch repair protein MutS [Clostridia bacterium]|nr:DNA mismatch repair protein MutS [Clostridia bacterium]